MNRHDFSLAMMAGAAASLISTRTLAATSAPVRARNAVLVHRLFADGFCWSEVIARLQEAGLDTSRQTFKGDCSDQLELYGRGRHSVDPSS